MSSCINFNKRLTHEKYKGKDILYSQKIKGNKVASDYELDELLKLHPNRKFIFPFLMPYTRAYLIGEKQFDPYKTKEKFSWKIEKVEQKIKKHGADSTNTKKLAKLQKKKSKLVLKEQTALKEGNWLMRAVGDPPAIYDSTKAATDLEQLRLFYQSNGYFESTIEAVSTTKKRKVSLTYAITENEPHLFNNINYSSEDPAINTLLEKKKKNRLLREGNNFSVDKITQERERLFKMFKNNGYYDFQRQQINFEVDSSIGGKKVDVYAIVDKPIEGTNEAYTIKKIYFLLDANQGGTNDTIFYNDIYYILPAGEKTSKKILNSNIKIRPNELYSSSKAQNSQQKLGNIDIFKFVNISFQKADSNTLNCFIHANSLKKYQLTSEAGANLNINQGQGLPGPFVNVSLKNRKVFNGFEILDISARYSIESQVNLTNQDQVYRSTEWGANAALWFPKLLIPGKFKYNLTNLYPKTRLQVGYTNVVRQEYRRRTINFSGNYELQNRKNQKIIFTPLEINIINTTDKTIEFENYLESLKNRGNNLTASFNPSIIEVMSLSYTFNNNDLTKNKRSYFFRLLGESGGQTFKLLHNTPNSGQKNLVFGLPYYQFYRLNSELRLYTPVSKFSNVVFRVNAGLARPFGFSDVLPYEKFFFSGGLNSNRAWNPRRLGPGTYLNKDENGNPDYRFEQQGEIIFESNLEYRGKLGGFLHGAAFIDVGNVWTIKEDAARPGSQFTTQEIWKQLAIGAGLGLRFDFSFLIFRLDVGEKLWDPGRQQLIPFTDKYARVYNIGIGYPF